jgi:hypothetical protein
MSKRASLIITDATCVEWYDPVVDGGSVAVEYPSEQLLADLRTLAGYTTQPKDSGRQYTFGEVLDAAARVRALLPEEEA